jgi:hypothetical protein
MNSFFREMIGAQSRDPDAVSSAIPIQGVLLIAASFASVQHENS